MADTKITLAESSILQNFSIKCKNNALEVSPEEGEWFIKAVLTGITEFLNITKSQTAPKIVAVSDLKGNQIIAAYIEYISGDDSEAATGNWNYIWAFDQEDLPKKEDGTLNGDRYMITDNQVIEVISRAGYDLARIVFTSPTFLSQMACYAFEIIADTLDQNAPAVEGESWAVELPGYFLASVSIEDGKKKMAFEAIGELKTKIKDDTATEK